MLICYIKSKLYLRNLWVGLKGDTFYIDVSLENFILILIRLGKTVCAKKRFDNCKKKILAKLCRIRKEI